MKVQFQILYTIAGVGHTEHIEWSRCTTQFVSDWEFGSDRAIAASESGHPDLPADVNKDIAAICDASECGWGDVAAHSAIGLLWCVARLTLACTGSDGKARLTVTRAGMTIICDTLPA